MNEKKIRLSLTGAIIILSVSILFSSFQISSAIMNASNNNINHNYLSELSRFNDNVEELIKALQKNK